MVFSMLRRRSRRLHQARHLGSHLLRRRWLALVAGIAAGVLLSRRWRRSRRAEQEPASRAHSGQAPARTHIQLSTHPAREEQTV
ncbi:MAG: hypothetical protein AB1505_08760 [Candidatus Latescibacterota bacterium]